MNPVAPNGTPTKSRRLKTEDLLDRLRTAQDLAGRLDDGTTTALALAEELRLAHDGLLELLNVEVMLDGARAAINQARVLALAGSPRRAVLEALA
jgi:hypothetical protein